MRVMVIVKANDDSETGVMPDEKILTDMGKFNEELVKAGVMLAGEGLHPSSKGKRVKFDGAKRVPFEVPRGPDLAARLASVLVVIYLVFNEGYTIARGQRNDRYSVDTRSNLSIARAQRNDRYSVVTSR